jgi:hypothetical protein
MDFDLDEQPEQQQQQQSKKEKKVDIVTLGSAVVIAALDPERDENETETRSEHAKPWASIGWEKKNEKGVVELMPVKRSAKLKWAAEHIKTPLTLAYTGDVQPAGTEKLEFLIGRAPSAADLSRMFSVPTLFAGTLKQNAVAMGAGAIVAFPGVAENAIIVDEKNAPLDPAPLPWSAVTDDNDMRTAAIIIGVNKSGERVPYFAKVRLVCVSGSRLVELYKSTIAAAKSETEDINCSKEMFAAVGEHYTTLLERVEKLIATHGGGDANAVKLVMHEYAVGQWENGKTTPFTKYVTGKPEEQPLRWEMFKHVIARDNRVTLTGKLVVVTKDKDVPFVITWTVPYVQSVYISAMKQRVKNLTAGIVPTPKKQDAAAATPANTEKTVAALAKKSANANGIAEVAAATVVAEVGVDEAAAAAAGGKGGKSKAKKDELGTTTAGTTTAGAQEPKSSKKKSAKNEDPDADVDDKIPPTAAAASSTTTTTGKRTRDDDDGAPAAAAAVSAKRAAVGDGEKPKSAAAAVEKPKANGVDEKPKETAAAAAAASALVDLVFPQDFKIGDEFHTGNCVTIAKLFAETSERFEKSAKEDSKKFGAWRGYNPQKITDAAQLKTANDVQRKLFGTLWQGTNYLNITAEVQKVLHDKYLAPKVEEKKGADEFDI